jgi:Domain of unknown function (DUF4124)
MRRSRLLFLALALAAATAVDAQKIGRYVFPDGRVVYSDQPVPGAKLVEELAPPPPASAPPPAPSREGKAAAPSDRPGVDRTARLREANAELQSATQALERARAQLEAGIEPLPGERTGTASGGSRLNEAYQARQEGNQRAVADAEERLKRAVAARNAAQF